MNSVREVIDIAKGTTPPRDGRQAEVLEFEPPAEHAERRSPVSAPVAIGPPPKNIEHALQVIEFFFLPGDVIELRALNVGRSRFDRSEAIADAIHRQIPLGPANDGGGCHAAFWHDGKLWIASLRLRDRLRVDPETWQPEFIIPFYQARDRVRYHGMAWDNDKSTTRSCALCSIPPITTCASPKSACDARTRCLALQARLLGMI